jgi:hypothetical protein
MSSAFPRAPCHKINLVLVMIKIESSATKLFISKDSMLRAVFTAISDVSFRKR